MLSIDRLFSVYTIKNRLNGKIYVGATRREPKVRWQGRHKSYLHNRYFYEEILKYGWDNFEKSVVAENLTKEQAQELEKRLIAEYDSTNAQKGYNHMAGGEGLCGYVHKPNVVKPMLGKKHTDEAKHLMSIAHKGTKQSSEWIEKRFATLRGRKREGKELERARELCKRNSEAKRKPVIAVNVVTGLILEFVSGVECGKYTGCTSVSNAIKHNFVRNGFRYCYAQEV